jgi:ABC-2 type transport system ATP-binding protein
MIFLSAMRSILHGAPLAGKTAAFAEDLGTPSEPSRILQRIMLEVRSLHKRYGDLTAVHEVSFAAREGEMVGLLGPNGAGKTTTVSMIAGLLPPDSGEVRIAGGVVRSETDPVKRRMGLVPQEVALHDELTARENLALAGALYGMSGAALRSAMDRSLEIAGLTDRAKDRTATFSGGMKRRLNLAAALLHDPQILLLDEPTVGVDPQSRNAIFTNLEQLKARGKTLVYTTHYMEEAERLCDRIIIIDHGNVIANDTLDAVRRLVPNLNVLQMEILNPGNNGWYASLQELPGVESVEGENHTLRVQVRDLLEVSPHVLGWLRQHGYECSHIASQRADLETVFLTLTGRSVRNA